MTRRRRRTAGTALVMYAIYGPNQQEHPGKYVRRPWYVYAGRIVHGVGSVHDDIGSARASVPHGCTRIVRDADDDPSIVETWI